MIVQRFCAQVWLKPKRISMQRNTQCTVQLVKFDTCMLCVLEQQLREKQTNFKASDQTETNFTRSFLVFCFSLQVLLVGKSRWKVPISIRVVPESLIVTVLSASYVLLFRFPAMLPRIPGFIFIGSDMMIKSACDTGRGSCKGHRSACNVPLDLRCPDLTPWSWSPGRKWKKAHRNPARAPQTAKSTRRRYSQTASCTRIHREFSMTPFLKRNFLSSLSLSAKEAAASTAATLVER